MSICFSSGELFVSNQLNQHPLSKQYRKTQESVRPKWQPSSYLSELFAYLYYEIQKRYCAIKFDLN